MSEEVVKELKFFGPIFGLIFCIWLFTGGPERATSYEGAFIQPISPGAPAVIYGPDKVPAPTRVATTTILVPGITTRE